MNRMKNQKRTVTIIRWTARIFGTILALFVLIMVGGELVEHLSGKPRFFIDSVSDIIGLLCFPLVVIGVIIGYKWEILGGIIILSAIIVSKMADGRFTFDLLTSVFSVSGLLFLAAGFFTQKSLKDNQTN